MDSGSTSGGESTSKLPNFRIAPVLEGGRSARSNSPATKVRILIRVNGVCKLGLTICLATRNNDHARRERCGE